MPYRSVPLGSLNYGYECLRAKDFDGALTFFKRRLALDPGNAELQQLVASTQAQCTVEDDAPGSGAGDPVIERVLCSGEDHYRALDVTETAKAEDIGKRCVAEEAGSEGSWWP